MGVLTTLLAQLGQPTPISAAPATDTLVFPDVAWRALLPMIVLALGAVLLLTFTSLSKRKLPAGSYALYTVVVAGIAMAATLPLWARVQGWDHILWWNLDTGTVGPFSTVGVPCNAGIPGPGCGAVGVDGFSLAITFVICAAIVLTALLADGYLRREDLDGPEFYVLMLLSAAGGVVMAMANDLMVLFLGLETLSIAVYVLAAMHRRRLQSQEAGLKYFVLGAFSSAFLLYGIAMVYGGTGSTNLVAIKNALAANVALPINGSMPFSPDTVVTLNSPLLILGLALMLIGLGFKVSAVPFHFWSPDVYDGSPSPVVAFMASAVKAAAFAALVRVFVVGFETYTADWRPIVQGMAVLSMVVGAGLAIVQTNVKRILAYSSISHAGFILMAVSAASAEGDKAILFYLIAYTFMVAGSFGIVTLVSRRGDHRTSLEDYRGLSHANPGLALMFTVFLLAQAGVPFTSGFVAKLYTVIAAVQSGMTWLAIVAMVSSVIGAYLYLRIIVTMYMSGDEDGAIDDSTVPARVPVPFGARLALGVCFVVTLWAGIAPQTLTTFTSEGRAVIAEVAKPDGAAPDATLPLVPSGR